VSALPSDRDIWRAATLLIQQHAEKAELIALERHAEMLVRQNLEGAAIWSRIRRAIKELLEPSVGRTH
jgi:hypothetical protein